MINLYISGKKFTDCLTESLSNTNNSELTNLLLGNEVQIWASDEDLWAKFKNIESAESVWARSKQINIFSGIEFTSAILAKGKGTGINGEKITKIKSGTASSCIISSLLTNDDTNNLACNPGILAIGDDNSVETIKKFSHRRKVTLYPIQNGDNNNNEIHSWSELITSYQGLPINSIIIIDNYAYKEKTFENISTIINSLLSEIKYSFHIQ